MSSPRSASGSVVAPTVRCPDCDGRGLVLASFAAWLSVANEDGAGPAVLGRGVFGESAAPRTCHGCRGAGRYDMRSGAKAGFDAA